MGCGSLTSAAALLAGFAGLVGGGACILLGVIFLGPAALIVVPLMLWAFYRCTIGGFLRARKRGQAAADAVEDEILGEYMVWRMNFLYPPGWTGEHWEPK